MATTLRRLATGVRSQKSPAVLGLSAKESKLLSEAADLLTRMSDANKKAAALAKRRRADLERRKKAVSEAMRVNFADLRSVADQVAFIGGINRHMRHIRDVRELREEFVEAIDSLAYGLARQTTDMTAESLVNEAWVAFQTKKAKLQAEHQRIIDTLLAGETTKQT